jgi:hypothetical protein
MGLMRRERDEEVALAGEVDIDIGRDQLKSHMARACLPPRCVPRSNGSDNPSVARPRSPGIYRVSRFVKDPVPNQFATSGRRGARLGIRALVITRFWDPR